jgi:hypothetical protein
VSFAENDLVAAVLAGIFRINIENRVEEDGEDIGNGEVSTDVALTGSGNHLKDGAPRCLRPLVQFLGAEGGVTRQ